MRQRPLPRGHPDGPRELERLVPDCRGMRGHGTLPYATGHGIWFSGQQQTDRKKGGRGVMTGITISAGAGIVGQMSAWVRRRQRALQDRVHAAGDERARSHGWTVTETTGRFGFGARIYRDPRFGAPRPALAAAPAARQSPPARSAASGADHVDGVVLDPVHDGHDEQQAAWSRLDVQACHPRHIRQGAAEGPAGRSRIDQRPRRPIAGR